MANYKKKTAFEDKPYERYIEELKALTFATDLAKEKQGLAVALSFPESDESQIRDKVFSEVKMDDLKKADGIDILINFMDNLFKTDELTEVYEAYVNFDQYRRIPSESMEKYVIEFEKLYLKTKKHGMELPQSVLAFKLLDGTLLNHKNHQLALTGVNYSDKLTLFKQMRTALKKFFGEQSLPTEKSSAGDSIKYEEVNATYNNYRRGSFNPRG